MPYQVNAEQQPSVITTPSTQGNIKIEVLSSNSLHGTAGQFIKIEERLQILVLHQVQKKITEVG